MVKTSSASINLRLLLLCGFVLAIAGTLINRQDMIAATIGYVLAAGAGMSIIGLVIRLAGIFRQN